MSEIPVSTLTIINGQDPISGKWFEGKKTFYFYSCGHCSDLIALRPDRTRPREKCLSCTRYLCEKKAGCMKGCTPIYALAQDRWEADPRWTGLLPEITGISPTNDVIL